MHRVFPASMRADGAVFDAYVSNHAINRIDVSSVAAPTLVMHALDDPGPPYAAAEAMVRRMPVAKLLTVAHGGHLMLGDHPDQLDAAQRFLRAQSRDLSDRDHHVWRGGVNDGSTEPEDLRDRDGDRLVGAVR
jgi:pimeloyl-ACP methyl ester carboxylesterase